MPSATHEVRLLVIGAGSRGHAYASAVTTHRSTPGDEHIPGRIVGVVEPSAFKRREFGEAFIWGIDGRQEPAAGEAYSTWEEWVAEARENGVRGVDAIVICVLDEMHVAILEAVRELDVHVMCEKPLVTSMADIERVWEGYKGRDKVLSVCHVLRYSPHNMMLRDLVRKQEVVGEIVSVEHTEPVGWWHFSHSYVRCMVRAWLDAQAGGAQQQQEAREERLGTGRPEKSLVSVRISSKQWFMHDGLFKLNTLTRRYCKERWLTCDRGNWRKESKTAPSLMTKSCHDIDFLLWLMCSPTDAESNDPPHEPTLLTSTGSRKLFRKEMKPVGAGNATNCMSCPIEADCSYSAKKIYLGKHLQQGNTGWPVKIVNPEIEECYKSTGLEAASEMLLANLREDYSRDMPQVEIDARPWFGRCVWEADNDVCDDQLVTMTWEDEPLNDSHGTGSKALQGRAAKTAQFHMIAFTENICERRGRIYGTKGEIEYDSTTIKVHDFSTGQTQTYHPKQSGGGHGGGDSGLARQFVLAVHAALNGLPADLAQRRHLGCTLEEEIRSHAMVFAAEESRHQRTVVEWQKWWQSNFKG